MKILALDLGTHTGWAYTDGTALESGTQTLDLRRGESPGMRFLRFRRWLDDMLRGLRPALVAYEAPHHRGGAATEVAVGFSTRVLEQCADLGIEHVSVHTATLKKHATGSGRAGKDDMIRAASERWGRTPATDDEADALCLLAYAVDEYVERRT